MKVLDDEQARRARQAIAEIGQAWRRALAQLGEAFNELGRSLQGAGAAFSALVRPARVDAIARQRRRREYARRCRARARRRR